MESRDMQDEVWKDVEATSCVIISAGKGILLKCIYRLSNATPEYNDQVLRTMSRMVTIHVNQFLLCGEFAFKDINWERTWSLGERK